MKKCVLASCFVLVFVSAVFAGGLVTGENVKFVPGDKVLYSEDFAKCPVGEIPEGFDRFDGSGECVKYNNRIWFSSITEAKFYKNVALGDDEFSIEYDLLFLKGQCKEVSLKLFKGQKPGEGDLPYEVRVGPGCSGEAVYVFMGNLGRIYRSRWKSLDKKLHVAVQVRRKQLRLFLNGKRLVMVPFKGNVTSVGFSLHGKYSELISNIKIAKYSEQEAKPTPEKLGIEVKETKTGAELMIPEKVLFDFNKFVLKPEAKEALDVVADVIKDGNYKMVEVIGYTDNIGSDEYNLKLSLQRAQSVADYLMYCENIDPGKIKIEGKGKADPIADNSTEEGRAKNRRVEIKLKK